MARYQHKREWYIPKGATKAADKQSSAVAYWVHTGKERNPYEAMGFHGRAQKPDWHFVFKSEAQMTKRIAEHFAAIQARDVAQAKYKTDREKPSQLQLGHVLKASWGYDQTNVDFYEVTKLVGPRTVEVRKISGACIADNGPQTYVVPTIGKYISDPMVKRVSYGDRVTIDDVRTASLWSGTPAYETGAGWGH